MDVSDLSTKLQQWVGEFGAVRGEEVEWPEGLCTFLARRLCESEMISAQEEWDVVRCRIEGEYRRVRIEKFDYRRNLLNLQSCDQAGWHLAPIDNLHPDDRGRAADILDRLEAQ